jgi:hypothetical protein
VAGVHVIVIVREAPTVRLVIAAVNVPVRACVVELYVSGSAAVPAVAVQVELNPLAELAREIGAEVFA